MSERSAKIPGADEWHVFAVPHRELQRYESYSDRDYRTLVTFINKTLKGYRAMPQVMETPHVTRRGTGSVLLTHDISGDLGGNNLNMGLTRRLRTALNLDTILNGPSALALNKSQVRQSVTVKAKRIFDHIGQLTSSWGSSEVGDFGGVEQMRLSPFESSQLGGQSGTTGK